MRVYSDGELANRVVHGRLRVLLRPGRIGEILVIGMVHHQNGGRIASFRTYPADCMLVGATAELHNKSTSCHNLWQINGAVRGKFQGLLQKWA